MRRNITSTDYADLGALIGCQPIEASLKGLGLLIENALLSNDIYSGNLSIAAIAAGNAMLVAEELLQNMRNEFNIWVYTHVDFESLALDVERWRKKVGQLRREPFLTEDFPHYELLGVCHRVCLRDDMEPFDCIENCSSGVHSDLLNYLSDLQTKLEQLNELPRNAGSLSEPFSRFVNAGMSHSERDDELRSYARFKKTYHPDLQRLVIYLLHRMRALCTQLRFPSLSPSEIRERVSQLEQSHLSKELLHPAEDLIPEDTPPLADDRLIAHIAGFLDLSEPTQFPMPDKEAWVNYLIDSNYHTGTPEGKNIVRLLSLFEVMLPDFEKQLKRPQVQHPEAGDYCPQLVSRCNACLEPLLNPGHTLQQLDDLFRRWLRGKPGNEEHTKAQAELKRKLFTGKTLRLRYYLYMLRIVSDTYQMLDHNEYEKIREAMMPEGETFGYKDSGKYPVEETFRRYLSDDAHNDNEDWKAIQKYLKETM